MADEAHRHQQQEHSSIQCGSNRAQPAIVKQRGGDVYRGAEQHPDDLPDPIRARAEHRHHAERREHERNQRLQAVKPRHQARIEPRLLR